MTYKQKVLVYANTYQKLFQNIGLVSITQVLIQLLTIISGLLIVRKLTTEEYAIYTVTTSIVGMLSVFSDGGISVVMLGMIGKNFTNTKKVGLVVNTAFHFRKKQYLIALLFVLPIAYYSLHKTNSSLVSTITILSVVSGYVYVLSNRSVHESLFKLFGSIKNLQKNQIMVNLGRTLLVIPAVYILPNTLVILSVTLLSYIYPMYLLVRENKERVSLTGEVDSQIEKEMYLSAKKLLPGVIYFSFSGQTLIWISAFLENTINIASVGALGRFAVMFGVLSVVSSTISVPNFSKKTCGGKELAKHLWKIILLSAAIGALITGICYAFSEQIVGLLGEGYENLNSELVLFMVSASVRFILDVVYSHLASQGIIINSLYTVLLNITLILLSCSLLDMTALENLFIMTIIITIGELSLHLFHGFTKMLKMY